MRLLPFVLLCALSAAPAAAQVCGGPRPGLLDRPDRLRSYLRCLEAEVEGLRRDQARLRAALAAQQEALAAIPADYANEDGRITAPEGRPVGRAGFVLSSRRAEAAASLALDRDVVEALCARPGGCTITLAHQALGFGFGDPRVTNAVGPCVFDYDPAGGAWFRGAACGDGEVRGIDGDGGATGDGGEVIAAAGEVCLFADAAAPRAASTAVLARDSGPGLFLVAAPDPAAGSRFRCELRIE